MTTTTIGGSSMRVMATTIPGVGVAMGARIYTGCNGGWSPWSDVLPNGASALCGPHSGGASGRTLNLGYAFQMAFIKTGPVTGGTLAAQQVAEAQKSCGWGNGGCGADPPHVRIQMSRTSFVPLACVTPDVTVDLGVHGKTVFSGIGSSTAPVDFVIRLDDCPAGLGRMGPAIQYRIDPTNTVLDGANAVVALDAGSSASGVGIQLLDGAGAVFPLSTDQAFGSYDRATGGSYTIPFMARYYQTGTSVGAGTANGAMTFTMTYQ
jgi:major type 1 subunit fimbrin (pilin)